MVSGGKEEYQQRLSNYAFGKHAACGCDIATLAPITGASTMPVDCFSCMPGSFTDHNCNVCPLPADTLRLPTSCVCSDANMADVADQAVDTWKVNGLS
jgi:hypothetical protein